MYNPGSLAYSPTGDMIKIFNALTGTVWRRRFWLPLWAFVLAVSLVGGVEAFVPTSELADLDDAVSIDAVVTPGQSSERARVTIRRSGARQDRKSTRLNSSHVKRSRMPSSA